MNDPERNELKKAIALFLGYTYYPFNTEEATEIALIAKAGNRRYRYFGWIKGDRMKVLSTGSEKIASPQHTQIARSTKDLAYDRDMNSLYAVWQQILRRQQPLNGELIDRLLEVKDAFMDGLPVVELFRRIGYICQYLNQSDETTDH